VFSNALSPILFKEHGRVIEFKLVQLEKALDSISVRLPKSSTDDKDEQPENAYSPIEIID